MWAIVVVMLGLLTGPKVYVVTDAGTFATKPKCEAAISAAVPSDLKGASKAEYEAGYRQYVCVRVDKHGKGQG